MEIQIKQRIIQLESQLGDPEVLDQRKIEIKLEAYNEILQLIDSAPSESQSVVDNEEAKKICLECEGTGKRKIYYENCQIEVDCWDCQGKAIDSGR